LTWWASNGWTKSIIQSPYFIFQKLKYWPYDSDHTKLTLLALVALLTLLTLLALLTALTLLTLLNLLILLTLLNLLTIPTLNTDPTDSMHHNDLTNLTDPTDPLQGCTQCNGLSGIYIGCWLHPVHAHWRCGIILWCIQCMSSTLYVLIQVMRNTHCIVHRGLVSIYIVSKWALGVKTQGIAPLTVRNLPLPWLYCIKCNPKRLQL
jgi:hypothetical protein